MRTRGNKLPDFKLHFNIRQSRKDPKALDLRSSNDTEERTDFSQISNILRPIPVTADQGHKKGRRGRTRLELIPAFGMEDFPPEALVTTNEREALSSLPMGNNAWLPSNHCAYEVR